MVMLKHAALVARAPALAAALALAAAGCDVSAPDGSGGVDGAGGGAPGCPGALVVASSDYASTNVSVVSRGGELLSASLISSASAGVGASAALSGDVVPPHDRPASGLVVLIDRYPNSVVTWVDPATAEVRGQLSVATGFASNPHDYLEADGAKAYVTRYNTNPSPGREPLDGGGDLLVVDRERPALLGRVDLGAEAEGGFQPRPNRLARVADGEAVVTLDRFDAAFLQAADARLVGLELASGALTWRHDVAGLANCGGLSLSPAGARLALACSGVFADGAGQLARSGLVLLDLGARPPREIARFDLAARFGAPLAPALAFASESLLVGIAYGDLGAGRRDLAFALDLESGEATTLAEAADAFSFGDVRCAPGCGDLCFLADAGENALRPFRLAGGALVAGPGLRVDTAFGLPPRAIGAY
ncbi:MAG TPA: hypothetical protein VFS43_27735 [Polyangiaceae bacterium]|nr:hypothetical protein [Polyangiaceae bacterium]